MTLHLPDSWESLPALAAVLDPGRLTELFAGDGADLSKAAAAARAAGCPDAAARLADVVGSVGGLGAGPSIITTAPGGRA